MTNIIKEAVRNVEEWSYNWGFKLSVSKSCFMTLTNKIKLDAPNIQLYGESMEKVEKLKYLGIWIDQKGTWRTQVENVEIKCKKVINLMRAIAGKDWGADKQSLIYIYTGL